MEAMECFYLAEGLGSPLCLTFVSVLTHREQAGHHASVQGVMHTVVTLFHFQGLGSFW